MFLSSFSGCPHKSYEMFCDKALQIPKWFFLESLDLIKRITNAQYFCADITWILF